MKRVGHRCGFNQDEGLIARLVWHLQRGTGGEHDCEIDADLPRTPILSHPLFGHSCDLTIIEPARLGAPLSDLGRVCAALALPPVGGHLGASGVNVTCATITDALTSTAGAAVRPDGAARCDLAVSWDPAPFEIEHRTWGVVHAGSIGSGLPPGADVIEDLVRHLRSTSMITFDLNIRPALAPPLPDTLAPVESLVAMADVVRPATRISPGYIQPRTRAMRSVTGSILVRTRHPRCDGLRLHQRAGSGARGRS